MATPMGNIFTKQHSLKLYGLTVIVVVSVCLKLAFWQWERADEKLQIIQQAELLKSTEHIDTMLERFEDMNDVHGMKTSITGTFLQNKYWFLDNKVVNNKIGYDLITVIKVKSSMNYLIVNLGFIEAPAVRSLPRVTLPQREITLNTIIKSKDFKGFTLANSPNQEGTSTHLIQYLDISYLAKSSGVKLFPVIAYQTGLSPVIAQPHFSIVVMPPEKHKAYALQWLLLAICGAVIGVYAYKKQGNTL
jgi:surfeit locus 1 family protein